MRCACVPVYFDDHLLGVAKVVAAPTTPISIFEAAIEVLKLVVSETCLNLTVSRLTEQVLDLKRRGTGIQQVRKLDVPVAADAVRAKGPRGANEIEGQSIMLVNRVLGYLQTHYQKPTLSLPKVAAALGCNPRYMTTRFTQVVGEHLHTHLLALRVTHACRLLIDTDLRVKEIAHESGFFSAGTFATTFRRHVGVSAVEYRRIFSRTI